MFHIALEMYWLHICDIIHRDLKSSKVLIDYNKLIVQMAFHIVDFEYSTEVVETLCNDLL